MHDFNKIASVHNMFSQNNTSLVKTIQHFYLDQEYTHENPQSNLKYENGLGNTYATTIYNYVKTKKL